MSIFQKHINKLGRHTQLGCPNFSIYRTPFDAMQASPLNEDHNQHTASTNLFLHILYMKTDDKTLSRNFNAHELELFCHNRFYGPLVVAYNSSWAPYEMSSFRLRDLQTIAEINLNFQNKSIKDDFVPACLLECPYLNYNLQQLFLNEDRFVFYMFMYKTTWCPTKKDCHDSKCCIYAHHLRDFRRPPEIFKYAPEDCQVLTKGVSWDQCPKGLKCGKCHTTVERLYHPDKFKRISCDKLRCNKSEICAFFHSAKEKNAALKLCKNYRKAVHNQPVPNINQLHERLQQFYLQQAEMHSQHI